MLSNAKQKRKQRIAYSGTRKDNLATGFGEKTYGLQRKRIETAEISGEVALKAYNTKRNRRSEADKHTLTSKYHSLTGNECVRASQFLCTSKSVDLLGCSC